MRAITFENVGTWVQYDALKGIIDNSSAWAVALDGDEDHPWVIVALEMTHDTAPGRTQHTRHWLVVTGYVDEVTDDGELYVIPLDEVDTVDF